jgi:hypothetical protein
MKKGYHTAQEGGYLDRLCPPLSRIQDNQSEPNRVLPQSHFYQEQALFPPPRPPPHDSTSSSNELVTIPPDTTLPPFQHRHEAGQSPPSPNCIVPPQNMNPHSTIPTLPFPAASTSPILPLPFPMDLQHAFINNSLEDLSLAVSLWPDGGETDIDINSLPTGSVNSTVVLSSPTQVEATNPSKTYYIILTYYHWK